MATVQDRRGAAYDVDTRWRPGPRPGGAGAWEVQVRSSDGPVVHRERLATSRAARARADVLAGQIARNEWVPPVPGAHRLTRDPVAMGDDATDNTRWVPLGSEFRLGDLLAWMVRTGPWVNVGERSTWLLAMSARATGDRRPLAVLDQVTGRPPHPREVVPHAVAAEDLRLGEEYDLHLHYLLTQDVGATLEHVRNHPAGPYRISPRGMGGPPRR